jgi:tetratricopeptide (TPR) repeat protein
MAEVAAHTLALLIWAGDESEYVRQAEVMDSLKDKLNILINLTNKNAEEKSIKTLEATLQTMEEHLSNFERKCRVRSTIGHLVYCSFAESEKLVTSLQSPTVKLTEEMSKLNIPKEVSEGESQRALFFFTLGKHLSAIEAWKLASEYLAPLIKHPLVTHLDTKQYAKAQLAFGETQLALGQEFEAIKTLKGGVEVLREQGGEADENQSVLCSIYCALACAYSSTNLFGDAINSAKLCIQVRDSLIILVFYKNSLPTWLFSNSPISSFFGRHLTNAML